MAGDDHIWWYPRMVVERTKTTLAVVVSLMLLLAAIPILLGHAAMSEETNFDWIISTAETSIRMDAVNSAHRQAAPEQYENGGGRRRLGHVGMGDVDTDKINRREWAKTNVHMRYSAADGSSLMTAAHLATICKIENLVMGHAGGTAARTRDVEWTPDSGVHSGVRLTEDGPSPSYKSICRLDEPQCAAADRDGNPILDRATNATPIACAVAGADTKCKEQDGSVLNFFFPAKADGTWDCANPHPVASQAATLTAPATLATFGWFLGRDVAASSSSRLRSTLHMAGMPFAGATGDIWDRDDNEPRNRLAGTMGAELQTVFWDYFGMDAWTDEAVKDGVEVIFWSGELAGHDFFGDMISSDLSYALGSIIFVLCIMCFHSKSFFLGGFGMLQVLCSLPIALFLYRTVAGITFITQMHILSIYLVLGIGADDLFVFYDAWIQSEFEPAHNANMVERMDYTYKRAATAMLTTSFTTCIAFIATAVSPLMPLSAFGLFASCAVFLNYVLVMLVFPCLVYIWEITGRKSCCCCNLPSCGGHPEHTQPDDVSPVLPVPTIEATTENGDPKPLNKPVAKQPDEQNLDHLRNLEKCFVVCYTPLMQGPVVPYVSVAVMFVSFIVMAVFAFQLSPPTKQEVWFPADHMVQRFQSSNPEYFGGDVVEYADVDFTWGLDGIDRDIPGPAGETYSRWEPGYRGVAVFDGGFSALGSSSVHSFFWATGKALETRDCGAIGCMDGTGKLVRPLNDGIGSLGVKDRAVKSFYVAWRRWYSKMHACSYHVPANAACAAETAGTCTAATKADCQGAKSEDCWWTQSNADSATGTCHPMACFAELPTGALFVASLSTFRDIPEAQEYKAKIGVIGNELKFLTIQAQVTLERDQPQNMVVSVIDELDVFEAERNSAAPVGLKNMMYSTGGGNFAWASTQLGLVENVFNGFRIVFPAAFLTLLMATGNWIVSLYAIATIAGIVAQVLGMCKAIFGWELGIAESIAAVIVIGFSVDFTVHLAHMYVDSEAPTRKEKMAHSARTMGLTVVMGSITTMGAGLFMYFCVVTFFTKFCLLICSTIGFSLAAALLFFMPLVATAGPAGDQGSLKVCFKKCQNDGTVPAPAPAPAPEP